MKKIFIFTLTFILLSFLAFLFVQFQKKPDEKINDIWYLEKVSDIKIMSIKRTSLPISDIQWSLFLKKLRYESLPISATFSLRNSVALRDSQAIKCRIEYKNIKIENTLTNLEVSPEGSFYLSSGNFSYNLSELKKRSTDREIKEFIRAFPSNPAIKYTISAVSYSNTQ